ncbi:hypothetical protein MIN45_PP19 (plasmid) [Methylomarinovum tepidoasis]|uniref:Transposase n=1 Tax=Methylomarinovum tepidoasis TaxID=2840183 RepID=A0AAU9C1M3_9GAMM|nr:hypothetical protein [Methylomarinovum sp. IN45]BCX90005.1 hypothetical protein MIN45_PP19 [Methylomarinovum sp. IN45]
MASRGRGGARPGAGRKPRWGMPTVVMRVPETLRDEVRRFIDRRMAGFTPAPHSGNDSVPREKYERTLTHAHRLEVELSQARQRIAALERQLERERTTRPLWSESGGRCQARTKQGTRCSGQAAGIVTIEYDGFRYEIHVCTRHLDRHRSRRAVVPAWECLPE